MEAHDSKLLTRKELAARWSCTTKTVDRVVAAGLLPIVNLNSRRGVHRTVRFALADVEAYELSNKERRNARTAQKIALR